MKTTSIINLYFAGSNLIHFMKAFLSALTNRYVYFDEASDEEIISRYRFNNSESIWFLWKASSRQIVLLCVTDVADFT